MKKVLNIKKVIGFCFILLIFGCALIVGTYFFLCSKVSSDTKDVSVYIDEGSTYSTISNVLKENNLIRSKFAYKVYIKLNPPTNMLEYGEYVLKESYGVKEIIDVLEKGSVSTANTVSVTFHEGKNMRHYVSLICEKFGFKEDEVYSKLSDKTYLDSLINEYWFLTEEIKNKDIYYPLEGYLFPDTYEFYETSTLEDIIKRLLDTFKEKIDPYKSDIEKSKYTFHQMLTLGSVVEQEAGKSNDRKGVADVFYNRLKSNIRLGSDVTTYYAEKKDDFTKDLKWSQLNRCNGYNTRAECMSGKLPVGPICNPSLSSITASITASITPTDHKYYYFVADKNGKTYFNETENGHINTINKLKREGLWIDYN